MATIKARFGFLPSITHENPRIRLHARTAARVGAVAPTARAVVGNGPYHFFSGRKGNPEITSSRWWPKLFVSVALLFSASAAPAELTLERTIVLPGVEGRIDHFAHDAAGHRLFVAALGNNSVEVVDLVAGKVTRSITGLAEPQGVFYLPELGRLYVAGGGDGLVRVFDGATFAPLASIATDSDADNLRYDFAAKRLYVGHGSGALGAIDVTKNDLPSDTPVRGHPESFQLEQAGGRAFVNVPGAHNITVIDRNRSAVVATWSVGPAAGNFPMALDEANHRLLVASRWPARLLVFDTDAGREVARLDLHGDCDDLFYDAARRTIYAACGEGFIDVFEQRDADHYMRQSALPTEPKARTAFFDGERLYLAVPKRGTVPAELRCYRVAKPTQ